MTAPVVRGRRGRRIVVDERQAERLNRAIDVLVDEDAIEHLDFDLVCELRLEFLLLVAGVPVSFGKTAPCGEAAIATMVCNICGLENLVCASHRARVASDPNCFCMRCKTKAHGSVLYRFTTLPGGA